MKKLSIMIFILILAVPVYPAPRVFFSDLTDGPVSGWEGSTTQGAAVSIWGLGFGSSGSVNIGGQAIPSTSCAEWAATSNPTTARGLQRITFFLNSSMSLGSTTISVTVGGETSSTIPFYTRNTGTIYFMSSTGSNSNDGLTVSTAWATCQKIRETVVAGDTVYIKSGTYTDRDLSYTGTGREALFNFAYDVHTPIGVANNRIHVKSYPGEVAQFGDGSDLLYGLVRLEGANDLNHLDYWGFSNIKWVSATTGILAAAAPSGYVSGNGANTLKEFRLIGNDMTSTHADTGDGVVVNVSSNDDTDHMWVYGNYFHHVGKPLDWEEGDGHGYRVMGFYHGGNGSLEELDYGWNESYRDNGALQIYGHHTGDNITVCKVHDNLIQLNGTRTCTVGGGDPTSGDSYAFVKTAYIYNNVFWWVGEDGDGIVLQSIGTGNDGGSFYLWNNSYYGKTVTSARALTLGNLDSLDMRNNIIYANTGSGDYYSDPYSVASKTGSNNLWYGLANSLPSWDNSETSTAGTDPLFTNTLTGDLSLQSGSLGVGGGTALSVVSGLFTTDYYGETLSDPVDIGAIQYASPSGTITCYLDADGDLYSDGTSESVETCSANYYEAGALTSTSGDCNDSDAAINPSATEICGNGVDEDCDGTAQACATVKGCFIKGGYSG